MKKVLAAAGMLIAILMLQGCAASIQVPGPIPPMEQIDAMTTFLMDEFMLPDSLRNQVREVVKTNAAMKKTIHELAGEGRIIEYDAERQRMHRFSRELEALLSTPEQKERLRPVMAAVKRSETADKRKWPGTNESPVVNDMGE